MLRGINEITAVVQLNISRSFEDKGNFAVHDKDCRNILTPFMHAFRWMSNNSPAKISYNYT